MPKKFQSVKKALPATAPRKSGQLLATASLAALSFAMAPAAYAQCATTGNDTVCTGTTNGQQTINADDQTVTVVAGATVESTNNRTFSIQGDRNVLVNHGRIIGSDPADQSFRTVSMTGTSGPITFINNGDLITDAGFVLLETTSGDVNFENTGLFQFQSGNAGGLITRVLSGRGNVNISNSGQIISASSFVLSGSVRDGTVSISNTSTGEIVSGGDTISAVAGGDILITNEGILEAGTSGIRTIGTGETVIMNDGAIIAGLNGISSRVTSGSLVISNDSVSGAPATIDSVGAGILVDFVDGSSASLTNSGAINTTGLGSLNAFTGASGMRITAQNASTNASFNVVNSADGVISTLGLRANGISVVNAGSGTTVIENAGTITTQDLRSQGLAASLDGAGSITITNSGQISTASASAIAARTVSADISVSNSGTVSSGLLAIEAFSNSGDISISNSGDLTSLFGVEAIASDGDLTINNSGSIVATEAGSSAIYLETSNGNSVLVLDNSGILTATSGSDAITAFAGGDRFELTSSGTINGGISTFQTEDFVSISGLVDGSILLRDGDDSLLYNGDGTSGFEGLIDGGDGDDGLIFASSAAYQFSQTANSFETVDVTGILVLDGASFTDGEAFSIGASGDLLVTTNGATIDAPDGFTNGGILRLVPDASLTITNGGFSALSGSTTIFGVDTATPQIVADEAIDFAAGSQIEINVLDLNTLVNGRSFDAAVSGTSVTDSSNAIIDNSMLFDFSSEIIGGNILRINANQVLTIPDAVDQNDSSALGTATGLQALVDAGDAALSTLFGQLPDDAAVANGVEQFMPGDSGGLIETAHFAMTSVSNVVQDRMQYLPDNTHAAGEVPKTAFSLWGNAILGENSGDQQGFAAGYDGSISGFVLGADIAFGGETTNAIIGGGYYHIDGEVDEFTIAANDSDLKTSGAVVYLKIGSGGLNAYLQGGFGDVDIGTQRRSSLTGETVIAAYGGEQTSFTAMVEYAIPVGGWTITPRAEFLNLGTDFDGYTEQAALGALQVSDLASDLARGKFELEAATSWQIGSGFEIAPEVRASIATSDYGSDALNAEFVDGGNPFRIALGNRGGTAAGLGAGVSVLTDAGVNFRISYDGEYGSGFDRHLGQLTAQFRF